MKYFRMSYEEVVFNRSYLNIEFRQMAVFDEKGDKKSGHRNILTKHISNQPSV